MDTRKRECGSTGESLQWKSGDDTIPLQDNPQSSGRWALVTIADFATDEPDPRLQVDGVYRPAALLLRRRSLALLGEPIGLIDPVQNGRHFAVEDPVFSRPIGIVLKMPLQVFEPMPLLTAGAVNQPGGGSIGLSAEVSQSPIRQSFRRRNLAILVNPVVVLNRKIICDRCGSGLPAVLSLFAVLPLWIGCRADLDR